jgi:two-component system OmpR family sensor kinase
VIGPRGADRGAGVKTTKRASETWRRVFSATRPRLLAGFVLVLVLSEVTSVVVLRQMLNSQLKDEIDTRIGQEIDEFRNIAKGSDPRTGRPFGSDVESIFDIYFAREVPDEGEALLAFIGDQLYESERAIDATYRLENESAVVNRLVSASALERGELSTAGGEVRYAALPLGLGSDATFVIVNLPASERAEIDHAVRVGIVVSAVLLGIALLLVWVVAGRVLSPLEDLADTAGAVSHSRLTHRIPVRGPHEVSQLAQNFNAMLDRLEEAFAIQRRFSDDAGHELRTPLTILRGHLELLGDDPEERRETIELVLEEIDRMDRMVNDLLVLAKAGQPTFLKPEEVELEELTSDVYAHARALAQRAWSLKRSGRGVIVADGQRLTQAMLQLAQNAVQHTSVPDHIEIGSALDGDTVRFWVRDGGPGIPAADQQRIFDRFARGSSERASEGAGLGLSIVRAIAEAHGGTVGVESRPGAGATFMIEFRRIGLRPDPDSTL